jgi:hypothetical protein
MYTDPSGELPWIVPILFSGYTNWIMNGAHTAENYGIANFVTGAAIAGISAGAAAGIGGIFGAVGTWGNEIARAGTHALSNGTISHLSGGDFWQGAAAGAFSSLAGSAFEMYGGSFANSNFGMYSFSAVSGGIGATIAGGNFWEGAAKGIIIAGYNHLKHREGVKLLAKLAKHYEFGGRNPYEINCDDLDFSGISRKVLGLKQVPYEIQWKNLQDYGINEVSLAFGNVGFVYQGNDQFSIVDDRFDFDLNIDASFKRNAGTFVGGAVFGRVFNTPVPVFLRHNYFFGGPFDIKFRGTVTIR